MAVRFFGQYLLENRVITAEQLLAGIAQQEKTNLKFGETAISLGLLSQGQLENILALQQTEDLKTGEAAVRLGLLTNAQVEQVLRAQQNSHVYIGEALVTVGALSKDALQKHLASFKEEQEQYRISEQVPKNLDPSGLGAPVVDLSLKFLVRLCNLPAKIASIRAGTLEPAKGETITARVGFGGDWSGEIALRCTPRLGAEIASKLAREPVPQKDSAAVLDGMREFVNVVSGNISASVAQRGMKFEVAAPLRGDIAGPSGSDHVLVCHVATPQGDLQLVLLTRPGTNRS